MKILYGTALIFVAHSTVSAQPQSDVQVRRQATEVMAKNSLTSEFAANPANTEIVAAIREASEKGDSAARVALLKIGDSHVAKICLDELRLRDFSTWMPAAEQIKLSGNPQLILSLIQILNTDESSQSERIYSGDEVFRIPPVSIRAAWAIRNLIINSEAFTPDVKSWAKQLDSLSITKRDQMRNEIRLWCSENKALLEARRYTDVKPPIQK